MRRHDTYFPSRLLCNRYAGQKVSYPYLNGRIKLVNFPSVPPPPHTGCRGDDRFVSSSLPSSPRMSDHTSAEISLSASTHRCRTSRFLPLPGMLPLATNLAVVRDGCSPLHSRDL